MLWALAVLGCGSVDEPAPGPEPSIRFARPLEVYRELDLVTGRADFPAVASFHTLAGPADSTLLLFGLSLPTSVLRFQRDGAGFAASYVVSLDLTRDGRPVAQVDRREVVRVADFAETGRTDESVVFQTALPLSPGQYTVSLRVRDGLSSRGFEATDTLAVPAYGPAGEHLAPPVAVYRAVPRRDRSQPPELVMNPRLTVPYGGTDPGVYLEAYAADPIEVELRDVRGEVVWATRVTLEPGDGLGSAVVALPVDSLPMGRFWILATAAGATTRPVPLLVTLSDRWLVANFDQALELIRYISSDSEQAAMAEATAGERRALWDAFWEARDPVPATPVNEYRDAFFERARTASLRFGEPGLPGWRTDRGEVFVVLGPPSRVTELRYDPRRAEGPLDGQEWVYERVAGGGLSLVFMDRTGVGVYRLTPASESAFRAVARRVRESVDRR